MNTLLHDIRLMIVLDWCKHFNVNPFLDYSCYNYYDTLIGVFYINMKCLILLSKTFLNMDTHSAVDNLKLSNALFYLYPSHATLIL